MNMPPFIFSNNQNYRLGRHALFWIVLILYQSVSSAIIMWKTFGFTRSFMASLIEVSETMPIDMCFCYFIIYYLFPEFLYKGRYISMLFLWWIGSVVGVALYELNAYLVAPHIRSSFGLPTGEKMFNDFWGFSNLWSLFSIFTQLYMEGCVTASIKLGKLRYINQQEISLLKQEKEKIQPHEEQNLTHPAFLIDLLKRIEFLANENPEIAIHSIKKIKNLLLYVLYEDASPQVSLQKEIALLHEYIDLEKLTAEKKITLTTSINVVCDSETIAPSIILPFIENAFKQVSTYSLQNSWIHIIIELNASILNMHLSWSKPINTSSLGNGRNVILHNLSKRLKLIYPQSHELNMTIEAESILVTLVINLKKAIN